MPKDPGSINYEAGRIKDLWSLIKEEDPITPFFSSIPRLQLPPFMAAAGRIYSYYCYYFDSHQQHSQYLE